MNEQMQMQVDQKKVEQYAFRAVGDLSGAFTAALGYIGDRLEIFKAMAGAGSMTSVELANKMKLNERYLREWLKAMVAAEYIEYDLETKKFWLTDEAAFVFANEYSPIFLGGGFHTTLPFIFNTKKIMQCFKEGGGIDHSAIGTEAIEGIERFCRPGYFNGLIREWLPSIPGLVENLSKDGARILDVGCGCGQSTIVMAEAFPIAKVVGEDLEPYSIARAREYAREKGLTNVEFLLVAAEEMPKDTKYDLICSFECIHDMGDPVKALTNIRELLKEDGVYIWGEPAAHENPLENRNLFGKFFCSISPFYCLTTAMAYGDDAIGNQLGEEGIVSLAKKAGFSSIERLPIQDMKTMFFFLKR